MAVQLSTSEQSVGYVEWDVNGAGSGARSYTRLYVKYAMESSTVARIYVRQVVATVNASWTWSGTNNRYRTRCDGYYDSGYNTYGSGWGHSETQVWSGSFTVSNSNEYSLQCYFATYGGTYYGETWTGVYVPSSAFASAPTGLAVSVSSVTDSSITGVVSITGWGNGANNDRYLELNVSAVKSTDADKRRYQPCTKGATALSQTLTCSNSSSGTMTIAPNTLYYVGSYATNGAASTGVQWNGGSTVTLCSAPTGVSLSGMELSGTTANVTFTVSRNASDGAYYTPTLQTRYSMDGGSTWTSYASQGSFTGATKDVTLTGLPLKTTVQIQARISTTAGTTSVVSATATTPGLPANLYVPNASLKTVRPTKLYVRGSDGKTKLVFQLYANQGGKTVRVFGRPKA